MGYELNNCDAGNDNTSSMFWQPPKSCTSRSIPSAGPLAGGMERKASINSISISYTSFPDCSRNAFSSFSRRSCSSASVSSLNPFASSSPPEHYSKALGIARISRRSSRRARPWRRIMVDERETIFPQMWFNFIEENPERSSNVSVSASVYPSFDRGETRFAREKII